MNNIFTEVFHEPDSYTLGDALNTFASGDISIEGGTGRQTARETTQ